MEFAYAGGGLGKGGQVTLYTDGKKVGEGAIAMTLPLVFSADDGCDVGEDSGSPCPRITAPSATVSTDSSKGFSWRSPMPPKARITSSSRRMRFESQWPGSNRPKF